MQRYLLILLTVLLWLGLLACTAVPPIPTSLAPLPTASPLPTPTLLPALPTTAVAATPTLPPDTGWQLLQPGLERRMMQLLDGEGRPLERLYLVRLEPNLFKITIAYRPGEGQSMAAWQAETGALLLVNGGYFTPELVATGRIVVDGVGSGSSYQGFGGMLAITADSVDIRSLAERPYDAHEALTYALQSFPMLVKPGGELGFPDEDGRRGRRTVVAIDENGRLLFILAPSGSFTLHQLSRYLTESDLQLDIALNLDGGTSTGLRLADPLEEVPAFVPLPAVIAIYPREN